MQVRGKGFSKLSRVEEIVERVRQRVERVGTEELPLTECLGRVLAVDVESPIDLPPFNRSAVDGYAVKAQDTYGASIARPRTFRLKARVKVGEDVDVEVREGEAVKVDTGSALPRGADAVVMVEYAKEEEGLVKVYAPVAPWQNVSRRGEDVKAGEVVLMRGRLLAPQDLGMAAMLGLDKLKVFKRPKVAIVPTGEELVEPGRPLEPGKVYNSNGYMLHALARLYGAEPTLLPPIRGDEASVSEALNLLGSYDALIFTGGSSAGEEDVVPEVLTKHGELIAHGVALKPGMPAAVALVGGKPVFSLPGFPVACMIAFEELVSPVLAWMAGMDEIPKRASVKAVMARRVPGTLGRRTYVRVKLARTPQGLMAEPLRISGSGVLSSVVKADGYVVIPEDQDVVEEGEEVEVKLYRGWVA